jgi:hypothetical protein
VINVLSSEKVGVTVRRRVSVITVLAAFAIIWLSLPGLARAADLSWSSVDYATNPNSANVLGQGLFQGESASNVELVSPVSISCPSATQCTAFGSGGTGAGEEGTVATFDPATLDPGPRAVVDANNGAGFDGTCVSVSLCVAIDGAGNVVTFDPADPGTPTPVDIFESVLTGGTETIACPAANECVALDSAGYEVTFDPSSFSAAGAAPTQIDTELGEEGLVAIACPSTAQCTAVGDTTGDDLAVMTFDPQSPGTPTPVDLGPEGSGDPPLTSIACPSIGQCTAVGNGNEEITFNPNDIGTPMQVAFNSPEVGAGIQGGAGVACAATDECFATLIASDAVDQGDPALADPAWTPETVPAGASGYWGDDAADVNPVACVSSTLCVAASEGVTVGTPAGGGSGTGPASTAVTTKQSSGGSSGTSISITDGTTDETDGATITGANAATATGTVSYTLYAAKSCDPALNEVLSAGSGKVIDGVAAPSQRVTKVLSPGTYYWQAVYSGDAANDPSTSTCGAEVLTVTPAVTLPSTGSTTSTGATLTVACSIPALCTGTASLHATGSTGKHAADAARAKTVTLGSARFSIKAHHSKAITIKLTKAGRKLIRADHGHLTATLTVTQKLGGHTVTTTKTIKLKPARR